MTSPSEDILVMDVTYRCRVCEKEVAVPVRYFATEIFDVPYIPQKYRIYTCFDCAQSNDDSFEK